MRLVPRPGPARVVAVTTAVAVATGAAGWLVGARVRSPADAAAAHRPPAASLITVAVERRTLTATVTARGTVAYGAPQPVTLTGAVSADDGTAAALVTKAPVAGRTLREGDVLLEVSGRPVFVLRGEVPMYRSLTRGSAGDDVRQVRAALRRLLPGRGVSRTGPLDGAALDAVAAWYDKRGYEATGPSREQRAELRRLEQAAAAATGPARSGAEAELAEFRRTYGIRVAAGEILFLPKLPARLTTVKVKAGGEASGVIGTVADPALVVTGDVATDDAELVRVGMAATMEHPSGGTFPATLSAMGAAAAPPPAAGAGDDPPGDGEEAPATGTPIRLKPKNPAKLNGLAGQSLKITIRVGGTGHAVLSVPVAAVYTASDGRARVAVQDGTGAVRDVPVEAGLTTGGYVQVTPEEAGALQAGDRVVVGSR